MRLSAILIALCDDLMIRRRAVLCVDIELRCIGGVDSAVRTVIAGERHRCAALHQGDGTRGRTDCLKRVPTMCGGTAREREHRIRPHRSPDIEFQLFKAHNAARCVCSLDRQFMTRAAHRAALDGAGNGRTFQIDLVIRCGRTLTAEDTAHGHATLERNLVIRGCTRHGVAANNIVDRTTRDFDRVLGRRSRRRVRVAAVDRAGDVRTAGDRNRVVVAVLLICRVRLRSRSRQGRNRVRIAAVGIRVGAARHGDIVLPRRVGNPRDAAVDIARSERR